MQFKNFSEIQGEEFPAGRLTKVIVGPGQTLTAQNFVLGYVTIYPGGSVPFHSHPEEEVYTVLEGEGVMTIGEETQTLKAQASVYIPSGEAHSLANQSSSDLKMLFVYSPANIVEHWATERAGKNR